MDRGLAYGEACFETFRVVDGAIFCWPEHVARLRRGLAEFGLRLSDREIDHICSVCLSRAGACGADALVRLTVSGGAAQWGLGEKAHAPGVFVQAMRWHDQALPLRLQLQDWPFPLRPKLAKFTADYAETLRALGRGESGSGGQGAASCAGVDADVLFMAEGRLLAAATANVLLFRQACWWTPKLQAGVLPGVMRQFLVDRGVVLQAEIPVCWLEDCEALAVSGCGRFVTAAQQLEERRFDPPGPALAQLSDALAGQGGTPKNFSLWPGCFNPPGHDFP